MTKAVVFAINNGPTNSSLQKLYGNPDDYVYQMGNDSFARLLPIHISRIRFPFYDFFHSISIDYAHHRVYFGNSAHRRLEYGYFLYYNDSHSYYFGDVPDTDQVIKIITVRAVEKDCIDSVCLFALYAR